MVFALISGSILLDTFIQWLSRMRFLLKTFLLINLGLGSAGNIQLICLDLVFSRKGKEWAVSYSRQVRLG